MSPEAETVEEPEEEEPEDVEEPDVEDTEDDRPEIEDDEKAELDLSDVDLDAVDGEETTEDDAEGDGSAEEDDAGQQASSGEEEDSSEEEDVDPYDGETWGDMYVDILATVLVSICEEHGEDSDVDAEEIVELANQPPVELNDAANRLFEEMGGTREMPPGQALVIGTATLAGTVVLRETDVANDVVNELGDVAGGDLL